MDNQRNPHANAEKTLAQRLKLQISEEYIRRNKAYAFQCMRKEEENISSNKPPKSPELMSAKVLNVLAKSSIIDVEEFRKLFGKDDDFERIHTQMMKSLDDKLKEFPLECLGVPSEDVIMGQVKSLLLNKLNTRDPALRRVMCSFMAVYNQISIKAFQRVSNKSELLQTVAVLAHFIDSFLQTLLPVILPDELQISWARDVSANVDIDGDLVLKFPTRKSTPEDSKKPPSIQSDGILRVSLWSEKHMKLADVAVLTEEDALEPVYFIRLPTYLLPMN